MASLRLALHLVSSLARSACSTYHLSYSPLVGISKILSKLQNFFKPCHPNAKWAMLTIELQTIDTKIQTLFWLATVVAEIVRAL